MAAIPTKKDTLCTWLDTLPQADPEHLCPTRSHDLAAMLGMLIRCELSPTNTESGINVRGIARALNIDPRSRAARHVIIKCVCVMLREAGYTPRIDEDESHIIINVYAERL